MEGSSFIIETLAGLILFAVGVRVLKLAVRTAGRPEWLLAIYLVLSGISYWFYSIPLMLDLGALFTPLTFAGRVIYSISVYFMLEFTRLAFRSGQAWATLLVYALMLSLFVGVSVSSIQGDWDGYSVSNPWFWCEWLGYTLGPLWVGIEGALAYREALKRVRIGLCEPILANRYLLWALFGFFQVCSSLVIVVLYAGYEAEQSFAFGFDLVLCSFEILTALMVWLAFCAPKLYRNWIAEGASSATSQEGS